MAFSDADVQKVWEKGKTVPGRDPAQFRHDECGAPIARGQYGNRKSVYGWEIDHISPGGSDAISNLRPLQWQNNVAKSDGKLKCVVTSNGNNNVSK
jgi:hypothetical protein